MAIGLAIGLILALQPGTALADPGGPRTEIAGRQIGLGLGQPNHRATINFRDPGSCFGFSSGGSNNPTSAYGSAYLSCEGTIASQSSNVHLFWCVATILGCNPFVDLGTMSNGYRLIFGPGAFWTPEYGNATMGGLNPGYSYMVHTVHVVVDSSNGATYQDFSNSAIFTTPMP